MSRTLVKIHSQPWTNRKANHLSPDELRRRTVKLNGPFPTFFDSLDMIFAEEVTIEVDPYPIHDFKPMPGAWSMFNYSDKMVDHFNKVDDFNKRQRKRSQYLDKKEFIKKWRGLHSSEEEGLLTENSHFSDSEHSCNKSVYSDVWSMKFDDSGKSVHYKDLFI